MDLTNDELTAAIESTRAAWRAANPGMPESAMPAALRADPVAAPQHTGLLVALWLQPNTAAQLAIAGGEAPEELHVTLCYCGDVTEMDDLTLFRAVAAVDRTVSYRAPLTGTVAGYGRFAASESSDARDVFYASVDMPGLAELRQDIANELTWAGCPPRATHGFTPHITLAYLDPGAPNPVDALPALPLRFGAVTIGMGERRFTIPLGGFGAGVGMVEACDRESGAWALFHELQAYADAPEWAPFLPQPGTYAHPLYGQIDLTPERIDRFVDQFKAGIYQEKLPVDAEHDLSMSGAVGWITDMRVNADGSADARVDWNARGKALIEGDRFRYVSPAWRETWQDPVTDEVYRDVAIGLAITTRPFFKERSGLRPLVASEGQLSAPDHRDGGQSVTWRREAARQEEGQMTKEPENTGAAVELTEAQAQRFADMEAKLAEREQAFAEQAKQLVELETAKAANEAKVAALETERQERTFTDIVRGNGGENDGAVWPGAIADNVAHLKELAAAVGEESDVFKNHVTRMNEAAKTLRESKAFEPLGSNQGGGGDAWSQLEAKAKEIKAAEPGLTEAMALSEAVTRNPDLHRKYTEELRAG